MPRYWIDPASGPAKEGLAAWLPDSTFVRGTYDEQVQVVADFYSVWPETQRYIERPGEVWCQLSRDGALLDVLADPGKLVLQPGDKLFWIDASGKHHARIQGEDWPMSVRRPGGVRWQAYNAEDRDFRELEQWKQVAWGMPPPSNPPPKPKEQRPWVTQELPKNCGTCRGKYEGMFARCPACGRPREK